MFQPTVSVWYGSRICAYSYRLNLILFVVLFGDLDRRTEGVVCFLWFVIHKYQGIEIIPRRVVARRYPHQVSIYPDHGYPNQRQEEHNLNRSLMIADLMGFLSCCCGGRGLALPVIVRRTCGRRRRLLSDLLLILHPAWQLSTTPPLSLTVAVIVSLISS